MPRRSAKRKIRVVNQPFQYRVIAIFLMVVFAGFLVFSGGVALYYWFSYAYGENLLTEIITLHKQVKEIVPEPVTLVIAPKRVGLGVKVKVEAPTAASAPTIAAVPVSVTVARAWRLPEISSSVKYRCRTEPFWRTRPWLKRTKSLSSPE